MEKDGIKASAVKFVHQDTNKTEILDVQTGKYSTERTEASTGILKLNSSYM